MSDRVGKWHDRLEPFLVSVEALTLDAENARKHEARSVETIAASLARFGQRTPVVVRVEEGGRLGVVLKGNGTVMAARSLGWTHLAALGVEDDDREARAYALVDNRSAEVGTEWRWELLSEQLRDLMDAGETLPLLGWEEHEYGPLLMAEFNPATAARELGGDGTEAGGTTRHVPPVVLTYEQRLVVDQAVARVRAREGDEHLHEGRCVELICADFLAGPGDDE